MPRYKSKPSFVEAVQFTGDNQVEVLTFTGAFRAGWVEDNHVLQLTFLDASTKNVWEGDYIVQEASGDFHCESSADFEHVFEPADLVALEEAVARDKKSLLLSEKGETPPPSNTNP